MPDLIPPTTSVHASFLEAVREYEAEGRGGLGDDSTLGADILRYHPRWEALPVFAEYVERTHALARDETERPAGHVPTTTLWYVAGERREIFLGRLTIRHRLTPRLLDWGGLIGYDVRPSARRRGHATAMLRASLPVARDLGLDRVLVTCDHDNVASRKVIEAGGGVYEDRRGEKLRYWIDTRGT
ncbi:GNAT family N-acetyltransferase [Streptomyces sp. B6B3]|uniref:GNAT family N-acetyltransferase n=1 Tax=Streptomyces sp. B6B3 TaxID=3153570 RepID=UPI00325F30CD